MVRHTYSEPAFGMEHHNPVIFLDLNIEDMTPRHSEDDVPVAELAFLDKEMGTTFLSLPLVSVDNTVPIAVSSWDSSIHDCIHLNRLTPSNERIYLTVKAYVKLSHPAPLDITLRKRICLNIYKTQSITNKLKKRITVNCLNIDAYPISTSYCKSTLHSHNLTIATVVPINIPFQKPLYKFSYYILFVLRGNIK